MQADPWHSEAHSTLQVLCVKTRNDQICQGSVLFKALLQVVLKKHAVRLAFLIFRASAWPRWRTQPHFTSKISSLSAAKNRDWEPLRISLRRCSGSNCHDLSFSLCEVLLKLDELVPFAEAPCSAVWLPVFTVKSAIITWTRGLISRAWLSVDTGVVKTGTHDGPFLDEIGHLWLVWIRESR